jgi:DNA polymerase III delta subunit
MPTYPNSPVYLFYGNRTDRVTEARDQVLSTRLPAEFRNENLTDYFPTKGETIKLADVFGRIAGDLETMSFIAEATKAVVVTNPAELYSGRGRRKKTDKSVDERIAQWIERVLPGTGHFLMLLAYEDESAGREVDERSKGPLLAAIRKVGYMQKFSDTKAAFRITDAMLARDLDGCLWAVRDLWAPKGGDNAVYSAVVRTLRLLMEANIVRERRLAKQPELAARLLPADTQRNILKAHPMVRGKHINAQPYRTADLLVAYEAMLGVYRAMRPRPYDLYVPDAQGLLEQVLTQLLTGRR